MFPAITIPSIIDIVILIIQLIIALVLVLMGFIAGFFLNEKYAWARNSRWLLRRCIVVNERFFPDVYKTLSIASDRLKVKMPKAYIVYSPTPNAQYMGLEFFPQYGIIMINSTLIENLNEKELVCTFGHELTHAYSDVFNIIKKNMSLPLIKGHQTTELICDIGGLVACDDLNIALSEHLKLVFDKRYVERFNIEDFKANKQELYNDFTTKLVGFISSHPNIYQRMDNLTKYYNTEAYNKIIDELQNR